MDNIVNIDDYKEPALAGDAVCMQCRHEWVAVAPVGVVEMECPQCHTMKGRMKYECTPPNDVQYMICACGNDLFYITTNGNYCPNCGAVHNI